jgi:guanylate kinase
MTPFEISKLSPIQRKECLIVYLDIPRSIKEERLLNRNDQNDSIKRRLDADEKDFMNFNDYDIHITDPNFDANEIIKKNIKNEEIRIYR